MRRAFDCAPSGNARVVANWVAFPGVYDGKMLDGLPPCSAFATVTVSP